MTKGQRVGWGMAVRSSRKDKKWYICTLAGTKTDLIDEYSRIVYEKRKKKGTCKIVPVYAKPPEGE